MGRFPGCATFHPDGVVLSASERRPSPEGVQGGSGETRHCLAWPGKGQGQWQALE